MKVKEIFIAPEFWTQGKFARDKYARETSTSCGYSFCLVGAINKCYFDVVEADRIIQKIRKHLGTQFVTDWNDSEDRKFEEVKKLVNDLDI